MIKSLKELKQIMRNSYNIFAEYYDELSKNINYKVRSEYISGFFNKKVGTLLDIACGTGEMTRCFVNKGFDVTAFDLSSEMLSFASTKCNADFLKADMRNFNFNNSFDFAVCLFDSINHLTDISEVKSCFQCVYNSLKKDGIFIFDVNTAYKHNEVLAGNTFIFENDDYYIVWDNEKLDNDSVKILLDIFIYNGSSYERFSESFIEKAYSIEEIKNSVSEYFEILGVYDRKYGTPQDKSQRLYYVCKRK